MFGGHGEIPTNLDIRKLHPLSLLLFNIVLEALANTVKGKGETKSLLNFRITYLKNSKEATKKLLINKTILFFL